MPQPLGASLAPAEPDEALAAVRERAGRLWEWPPRPPGVAAGCGAARTIPIPRTWLSSAGHCSPMRLHRIRFGSIAITVHDGRIVQLDVTEKRRLAR